MNVIPWMTLKPSDSHSLSIDRRCANMPHAALLAEYEKRLNSHRWEEIAPLIDDDAIFIFSEGTYRGKAAIEEACRRTFALISNEKYEISDKNWSYAGPDWACCAYTFNWQGTINGAPAQGGGRGTSVVRRTDHGWKIVHEHLGPHAIG